ncbi:MAG: hypothetical protein JSR77_08665 [Planctomycetes bacterium]|nr:hypothetical protein [Planctomycetota bacterium]
MKADYITYRQATRVSIGGIVLQTLLASGLLIHGILGNDHTSVTGSAFAAAGILAWLCLAIVFDQHRRERIEAMETEALATSPTAGTSVFTAGSDEFRPAARRLAGLHKYFVPIVSIVIGLMLVGAGVLRFVSARGRVAPEDFSAPTREGWGLGLGLTIAVLGFTFARYVAGLAKQPAWAHLRGGAAFAIGTSLIGLAMGVANFVDLVGPPAPLRYLQVVVPGFLVLIGVEVFLHFVLGVYRPRKAGELPHPAFDSRLLGLLSTPDRIAQSISDAINYQLGFDVTGGWFYQLLSKAITPLVILGLAIVWMLSCVAVIKPHQRGILLRFGAVTRADLAPGWHFKLPWPIDSVYIPEYYFRREGQTRPTVTDLTVTGLRTIELGTAPPATKDPILWTNDHAGEEIYQFVRAAAKSGPDVETATRRSELTDIAMISAEMPLRYAIKDVLLYDELGPPQMRDDILKTAAQRVVVRFFQTLTLDDVLGGTRTELNNRLGKLVQQAFDQLNPGPDGKPRGAGVEIIFLAISGAHPPKDAADAFEKPVQADQKMQAHVQSARANEIKVLTEVAGDPALAKSIVNEINALDKLRETKATPAAVREQEIKVEKLLESAGGSAAATLASARADRWKHHMEVRGLAARHAGRLAMYKASPMIFRYGAYYDTMKQVMAPARVYIVPDRNFLLDFDNKDKDFGQDIFKNFTKGEEQK